MPTGEFDGLNGCLVIGRSEGDAVNRLTRIGC